MTRCTARARATSTKFFAATASPSPSFARIATCSSTAPRPIPRTKTSAASATAVAEEKAVAGLATDGDADRFGIVDRDGTFISPNHILGLVFDYLIQTREHKGGPALGVARSVATTHLLDAVAKADSRPVFETPVGFKYIGAKLIEKAKS